MADERIKVGEIPKDAVEKAKKERRFLYVDWNDANVYLSKVSKGGGKRLSDDELKDRKASNERSSKRRKEINRRISELKKEAAKAGREGRAEPA